MKKTSVTICITGAGTATALSVIKGIRQQNEFAVRVVACDHNDNVSGHYMSDVFYKIPTATKPTFLKALLHIVKKEHVQLLIPIVDYEFETIAAAKAQFTKLGCTVILSDLPAIKICIDKFKTMRLFDSLGLPRPKSYSLREVKKIHPSYPLFIKPSLFGRATIDAYKIADKTDLQYYLKKIPHPIIQEFIVGHEITIDVLNDFKGKFVNALARERIETKSGLSIKGVVLNDPHLTASVKHISESLPIIGPANIQCFKRGKQYIFSEVNPRFSGAHAFSIAAGLNSIHLLLKLYTGQTVKTNALHFKTGLRVIRYWEEIFVDTKNRQYQAGYTLIKE